MKIEIIKCSKECENCTCGSKSETGSGGTSAPEIEIAEEKTFPQEY